MLRASRALAAVVLCAACACAGAPKSPPRPAAARAPSALPRSSIAAVLGHRAELALDAEQVKRLEQADAALARKEADLREGAATAARDAKPAAAGGRSPEGRRGMRGGGAGPEGPPRARPSRAPRTSEVELALDDADTAAFLEAEKLLREDQRHRAREIAESYREALYDEREQARRAPAASRP